MTGGKILLEPFLKDNKIHKGAVILTESELFEKNIPSLRKYFYVAEWRGWEGMNDQKNSDIKLVEDYSTWEKTKQNFPSALLLNIGPADFVDTNIFCPLNQKKNYCGIQISRWDKFKRQKLYVEGTSLFKNKKFILFGHFAEGGSVKEVELKNKIINLIKKNHSSIYMPYKDLISNIGLPFESKEINEYINKAKMGIITTKMEGINRFTLECLSADIPMLVPNDTGYPPKKHINSLTGILYEPTPSGLKLGIEYVLNNYSKFSPREYVLGNTGKSKSSKILLDSLNYLAQKDGFSPYFNNLSWDGRNQSMDWGKKMEEKLNNSIKQLKI